MSVEFGSILSFQWWDHGHKIYWVC